MQNRATAREAQQPSKPTQISISDLVVRNAFVGAGTASVLYPLDLLVHWTHNKSNHKPVEVHSTRPCRMALFAAAWTSYRYAVTGATMKITSKQQSQGAKAYLLDEKVTINESMDPMETVADALEGQSQKSKKLNSGVTSVGASLLFGGAEAFITQSNANKSSLSKHALQAQKYGVQFSFPEVNTAADRFKFRLAAYPVRVAKSSLQVGAYMATESLETFLLANKADKFTAKAGAIGTVALTFGTLVNAHELLYSRQIKTMSKTMLTVDSAKKIFTTILKESGPRGLLAGAGTSIFYTGVVQTIVPPIEALAETAVIPSKRELQTKTSTTVSSKIGFFASTGSLDKIADQIDEEAQYNPFKRPGMD